MKSDKAQKTRRELLLYLVFGVLTTLVGMGTYFGVLYLGRLLGVSEESAAYNVVRVVAQILHWIFAVLFAYFTNKTLVFEYEGKGIKPLLTFAGARLFSLGADTVVTFGTVAVLAAIGYVTPTIPLGKLSFALTPDVISKILSNVVVLVLNYILSKWLVFRKKEEK